MFDLTGFDSKTEFKTMPDGEYKVQCTDAVLKDTKKGDGKYISVTLEVLEPTEFSGRKIFTNFNVVNPNPKAVEVGMSQLKNYLIACDFSNPNKLESIDQLVGLRCIAKTRIKTDPTYGDRLEVHYFLSDTKKLKNIEDLPF